jgi:hypothetical protein
MGRGQRIRLKITGTRDARCPPDHDEFVGRSGEEKCDKLGAQMQELYEMMVGA